MGAGRSGGGAAAAGTLKADSSNAPPPASASRMCRVRWLDMARRQCARISDYPEILVAAAGPCPAAATRISGFTSLDLIAVNRGAERVRLDKVVHRRPVSGGGRV